MSWTDADVDRAGYIPVSLQWTGLCRCWWHDRFCCRLKIRSSQMAKLVTS